MRHTFWLSLLPLLLAACATAQPAGQEYKRRDAQLIQTVRQQIDGQQYAEATANLDRLLERYPNDDQLFFLRSTLYTKQFAYREAADDIRRGIELAERPNGRAYQELGAALSKSGDFAGARKAYARALDVYVAAGRERSIPNARRLLQRAAVADSLARNPVAFEATAVPGAVNTSDNFEYHPTLSVDGSQLIFTRRVNREQEDFYVSERLPTGRWGEASPLPGINTPYDEGAQTVTADGTYMVYTSCNSPAAAPGCDLYESFHDGERWTPGQAITAEGINTLHYEAQPTLTRNGQFLVFSSKRPGGKGGADLYITARLPGGGYVQPAPLKALNTTGNEQYPFWGADGETLYFTSDGLPGLGGDDLFVTRLDSTGNFTPPRNLGYPINTAENETNMFIPLSADTAYFSKRYYDARAGLTQIGLYQFPLPLHLRPRPATYVQATVTDAETGQPLVATVTVQRTSGNYPARERRTGPGGTFLEVLTAGETYAVLVDEPGYLYYSSRFSPPPGASPDDPYEVNITLQPPAVINTAIATTRVTTFENVLFFTGSAELRPFSQTELGRLADFLVTNPELRVRIAGHTDSVGEEPENLQLSRDRAASVAKFLAEAGVAGERIDTVGYGESRPVADNATEEGRRQNRRTTFQLLK